MLALMRAQPVPTNRSTVPRGNDGKVGNHWRRQASLCCLARAVALAAGKGLEQFQVTILAALSSSPWWPDHYASVLATFPIVETQPQPAFAATQHSVGALWLFRTN